MRQVTELKEMQSLALTILKGINEFCSEYKISYYLAYGTLLGAIRHKGFIPWDDDIDLWMKRDEFNILCENFQAWGLSHGLYINSIKTVQNYNRVHAKICLKNTQLKENERVNQYEEGYFVDVFPLDGTPNSKAGRLLHLKKLQLLKNIVTLSAYNKGNKSAIAQVAKLFRNIDSQSVLSKYEKLAEKCPCDGSYYLKVISPGSKRGRDILIDAIHFEGSTMIPFEDTIAMVPSGYDSILRDIYGDYMQLPPEEARKPHHDFTLYINE